MSLKALDQISFEGYRLDRARWTLHWQEEPISISRKTFDLLVYLIDHRSQVATKDEVLNALWPKQVVEESNLTQQIFLLRKALSRHSSDARIIETVPGRGYRFAAQLQTAAPEQDGAAEVSSVVLHDHRSVTRLTVDEEIEESEEGEEGEEEIEPKSHPRLFGSWPMLTATAILVLALAAAGVYGWRYWQNRGTGKPVAVVLADFDAPNIDPALGPALNAAIRIDLSQSPFVTVLPPAKVEIVLTTMRQRTDAELTPALAREVCERIGSQAVLQGGASKFGGNYLVSLRATNCLSGELLAEDKRVVAREEGLPDAIDELTVSVRRKLGEARASIKRFDKPPTITNTKSLPALNAYNAGKKKLDMGDYTGAVPLMQRAVEIDPDYGEAYLDLATAYYDLGDAESAVPVLKKAFELRDTMGEPNRLYITAIYYEFVEEDLEKSVPAFQSFAALHPGPSSLGQLANVYNDLGRAPLGVDPAQRALASDPSRQVLYKILAAAQLQAGMTAEAAHTCDLAIARNPDDAVMRDVLLMVDFARRDTAGVDAQLDWSHAHPGALDLQADEIDIALARGEISRARSLLHDLNREQRAAGLQADYETGIARISRLLADEGLIEDSAKLTKLISSSTVNGDLLVALAEDGLTSPAAEGLAKARRKHPHSTLWIHVHGPEVEAAILLAQHKPGDALSALEPALGFEKTTFGDNYLRGEAYLQTGQFAQAVSEYKTIIDSPWIDPTSNLYPLSFLEMARAQVQLHDLPGAKASYAQFLQLWKTADPDAEQLLAAKREMKSLP